MLTPLRSSGSMQARSEKYYESSSKKSNRDDNSSSDSYSKSNDETINRRHISVRSPKNYGKSEEQVKKAKERAKDNKFKKEHPIKYQLESVGKRIKSILGL